MVEIPTVEELGVFGPDANPIPDELRDEIVEQLHSLRAAIDACKGNFLANYFPNPSQWEALNTFARFLYMSGGNQLGKSYMLYFFLAWTIWGRYPKLWRGPKMFGDIKGCAASLNEERLYANISAPLFGPSREELGQGWIPAECIDPDHITWDSKNRDLVRRARLNRFDENGHYQGRCRLNLYAYTQQFPHGDTYDFFACDEEFSNLQGYYGAIIARLAKRKGRLIVSATPEHGITEMYRQIKRRMREGSKNHKLMYYGVRDATHMSEEEQNQYIEDHKGTREYALRVEGKPIAGEGAAFDLDFSELMIPESTRLGDTFKEIIGIDIPHVPQGIFTAVKCAYSEFHKQFVVLESLEISERDYSAHISALIEMGGDVIPIAWPRDSKGRFVHGESFKAFMERHHLNVLDQSAHEIHTNADTFKMTPVRDIWPICQDLQRMMVAGDFMIMDNHTNVDLVEQLQTFEFDENRKADKHQIDDLADAMFKAYMMRRFAVDARTSLVGAGDDAPADDFDVDFFA